MFRYRLPAVYDEWVGQFLLEFQPGYSVPKYFRIPTTACVSKIHIDILDAITPPCAPAAEPSQPYPYPLAGLTKAQIDITLCICEIWLQPAQPTSHSALNDLAAKIMPIILLEHMPVNSSNRVAGIMSSTHTAEFGIVSISKRTDSVTLVCIPIDKSRILLRISATDRLTYAAVVFALARRLKLLLMLCRLGETGTNRYPYNSPVDGSSLCPLEQLQAKYATVVSEQLHHKSDNAPKPFENVDCVVVEYSSLQLTD